MNHRFLLLPFLALALTAAASAATLVSNLANTTANNIYLDGFPGNTGYMANSFTTSTSAISVASLSIQITESSGTGTFTVGLYTNDKGHPGTQIIALHPTVSLPASTLPSAGFLALVGPGNTPFSLAANTTYWFIMTLESAPGVPRAYVRVPYTTDLSETSASGLTIGHVTVKTTNSPTWNSVTSGTLQFGLQGSVQGVPEPTSAALILLSGGLLLRRNRSRRAA